MNYNNEKLNETAAVTPETELDEMFDEETVGGAVRSFPTLVCPITIRPTILITSCPIKK